jgi:hypothetical protein
MAGFFDQVRVIICCQSDSSRRFPPDKLLFAELTTGEIRRKTLRFFGTWNYQFRSSECDPVIRLASAGSRTSMVLSKDAAKARAFGRDRAPASVWCRVFLTSTAFSKNDAKGTGLVRRGHVSWLSVRKICLFYATSRR